MQNHPSEVNNSIKSKPLTIFKPSNKYSKMNGEQKL